MQDKKYVWDVLVRVFHWSLVLAFIVSYLSGDEWQSLHVISGYVILGLILVRLVWGIVGSKHARFSDFVRSPVAAFRYLKSLFSGSVAHYEGHNPAGGLMVVALLVSLLGTGFSGLKTLGYEGEGPFAIARVTAIDNGAHANISVSGSAEKADADERHHSDQASTKEHEGEEFWEEIHEFFVNFTLLLVVLHLAGVYLSSRAHGENLVRAMITGFKSGKE
ncbi:cytochrome b/b6 domain-containing protein [Shewanella sp. GXUN23E]|uniref:cytochrome b/b6 domain-containing protein n=1 Tax=Shewanella sp. GXUN23E TaxID=3422498 RepID=UPI003D7E6A7A